MEFEFDLRHIPTRLILVLLYDSLNLVISGFQQSHLGCWSDRLDNVNLIDVDYVVYKMCQYAVLVRQNYCAQCVW